VAAGTQALNVLIVSSRFPWPSYTGDRIRASIWLDALHDQARVTLVAPAGTLPADAGQVRHIVAKKSAIALANAVATTALRGLPYHALIAAGFDWKTALEQATTTHGPFDRAIVLLSRLDPWVRPDIIAERIILDAVDSLGASTAERARAAKGPARLFWSTESLRTSQLERKISAHYDRILIVSDDEAGAFHRKVDVISNGITIEPLSNEGRTYDCAFWGRLGYFANQQAAMVLLEEVWPRIRSRRSDATLLVAGADAPAALRSHHGRDGIEVRSPVGDLRSLVRRVRIALFPVQFGTGQATKVLEAAEAACALVATPEAVRGLGPLAAEAMIRRTAEELADATVELLGNPEGIRSMGSRLRTAVQRNYSREQTLERLRRVLSTE
jgi:glycosyltransferase involved in cell wall biosynthesis